jgi:hypothetical protein
MQDYRTLNLDAPGDFIASVAGLTTDYDLTLDNGIVIEGYDETASVLNPDAAPEAGDLCLIGVITNNLAPTGANAEVVSAAAAAIYWIPRVAV